MLNYEYLNNQRYIDELILNFRFNIKYVFYLCWILIYIAQIQNKLFDIK